MTTLPLSWSRLRPMLSRNAGAVALGSTAALVALGAAVNAMPRIAPLIGHESPAHVALTAPPAALPAPDNTAATQLQDVAPGEAIAINAGIPMAAPAGAAAPFAMGRASADSRAQALNCLSDAIYYEAGQQDDDGQRAVGQVILNRVRHPAFPNSVCGVVFQGSTRPTGCQFTFTCDGSMTRAPMRDAMDRARRNAAALLAGAVYAPVGNATHYHANYVLPYWAASLTKTQVVGPHLFYRWSGSWGQPSAFVQPYGGHEGNAAQLRLAALAVPHQLPRALSGPTGASAAALAHLDGVVVKNDGGRVTAHFAMARAATDRVKVVPYVERVAASDNLRYALGEGDGTASDQQPLGPSAKADAPRTETASATR